MIVRRVVLEVSFFDELDRTVVVFVRFDGVEVRLDVELVFLIVAVPLCIARKSSSEYPLQTNDKSMKTHCFGKFASLTRFVIEIVVEKLLLRVNDDEDEEKNEGREKLHR